MRSVIVILLCFVPLGVKGQTFYELESVPTEKVHFDFGGVTMSHEGNSFSLKGPIRVLAEGGGGFYIHEFVIANKTFNSALIKMVCADTNHSEFGDAQSYFVSIGFFDEKKQFIFGHSFASDHGFSLAGVRTDLQATELKVTSPLSGIYLMEGQEEIAIHQAFLYGPDQTAGGILPIKYVTIKACHMGAG